RRQSSEGGVDVEGTAGGHLVPEALHDGVGVHDDTVDALLHGQGGVLGQDEPGRDRLLHDQAVDGPGGLGGSLSVECQYRGGAAAGGASAAASPSKVRTGAPRRTDVTAASQPTKRSQESPAFPTASAASVVASRSTAIPRSAPENVAVRSGKLIRTGMAATSASIREMTRDNSAAVMCPA